MPAVVKEQPGFVTPPRMRWTRSGCAVLEQHGLWDQEKLELIDGELVSKRRKPRSHAVSLSLLVAWLFEAFGADHINANAPIDVSTEDNPSNEPEPDLIVLARPSHEILSGNPQPSNVRLVVEISDSTLGFDLKVKAPLYARAGIPEYWVVDIAGKRVIVHRDPSGGAYTSVEAYSEQESVQPLAAPGHAFPVSSAFPR